MLAIVERAAHELGYDRPMNEIVEAKTVKVGPPDAPIHALMIAVNVLDPSRLEPFVAEVVQRFMVQRTMSPPSTSHFLLTVRGDVTPAAVRTLWLAHVAKDPAFAAFMKLLQVGDVVVAGRTGPATAQASLLP